MYRIAILAISLLLLFSSAASADSIGAQQLMKDALDVWSVKASPSDAQYMSGGQWFQDSVAYPAKTQGGPATAAALLWRETGDWHYYTQAVQTVGWMLNNGQRADGAFADPSDTAAAIPTQFFAQELGTSYLLLEPEPHFLPEQGAWWRQKLTKAADFLINHGDSTWYANGNVNIGYLSTFYLAARITGLQRFHDAYEQQLGFVQAPTTKQFASYGWQFSVLPTMRDGSTGAGYFTEASATSGPGFDAEYTGVQLDELLRIYILSGDPDIKRFVNLELNQLLPRINRTTWQLDTSGGTRHPDAVRTVPFESSAIAVMEQNGRTDLAGLGAAQWPTVDSEYRKTFVYSNVNFYKGLGDWIALIPLDELVRSGAIQRVME